VPSRLSDTVSLKTGKALGIEGGRGLGVNSREKKLSTWSEFVLGRQHHDEMLIALGRLCFGEIFEINFWGRLYEKHAVQRGF
jgi:hypothetical protein